MQTKLSDRAYDRITAQQAAARTMLEALKAIRDDLHTFKLWDYYDEEACQGLGGACCMVTSAIRQAEAAGLGEG